MTRRTKQETAEAPDAIHPQLDTFIEKAKSARLNTEEERQAGELLGALILDGRAGLAASVPAALSLPWLVGVTAFSEAWEKLSPTARRSVVTMLEKEDAAENGRRFRLSLARGILPADPATAEKLITNVAGAMLADGAPSQKDRQTFANVLLGKSKPWIARAPVQEWKGAKKISVVAAYAVTASPPFAQPGIIRWLHETDLLTKLPEEAIAALAGEMRRWKNQQRKELGLTPEQLPASLAEALSAAQAQAKQPEKPVPQRTAPPKENAPRDKPRPEIQQPAPPVHQPEERRPQPSEEQPKPQQAGQTDVPRLLRQVEQEFARLRNELTQARSQSRQQQERQRKKPEQAAHADPEEIETLRRCNVQLEERIADLRAQLEDLATHDEDHATIRLNGTEAEQFRSLLSLKLQEDYEMFVGLRNEAATEVVRRSLIDVMAHVFNVLSAEGVSFAEPSAS